MNARPRPFGAQPSDEGPKAEAGRSCAATWRAAAQDLGVGELRLDGFSVEKLMDFIVALGRDEEIVVRPVRGDAEARVSVLEAA